MKETSSLYVYQYKKLKLSFQKFSSFWNYYENVSKNCEKFKKISVLYETVGLVFEKISSFWNNFENISKNCRNWSKQAHCTRKWS